MFYSWLYFTRNVILIYENLRVPLNVFIFNDDLICTCSLDTFNLFQYFYIFLIREVNERFIHVKE